MSYYYKYKFVSPDPVYALVKEELKSYFDTGAIDDLAFPIWTEKCLRKLGRSSYKILHVVLNICDFEAKLPPGFMAVREAWMTSSALPITHRVPGAYYSEITTQLNPDFNQGVSMNQQTLPNPNDPCNPEMISLVYKTTSEETQNIRLTYLLKPGNIACRRDHCAVDCLNYQANSYDSFDIHDNKFITNFREGVVYLIYYTEERDESGYQLIPDNYRIQEYVEAFLKQKVFEQLYNQVVDETFNQIERKYQLYTQKADEAFIMADIEIKKQTVYEKFRSIHRDEHRLDKYDLDRFTRTWRDSPYRGRW